MQGERYHWSFQIPDPPTRRTESDRGPPPSGKCSFLNDSDLLMGTKKEQEERKISTPHISSSPGLLDVHAQRALPSRLQCRHHLCSWSYRQHALTKDEECCGDKRFDTGRRRALDFWVPPNTKQDVQAG